MGARGHHHGPVACAYRSIESKWTWIPAGVLFFAGVVLYRLSGTEFSFTQLGGLPEILPDHGQQPLATTGIRARVRHPVYLAHLCEMLAWSFGTGLAVCWALTAFAIMTGAVMIQMEDGELEKRFGEEYRHYQSRRARSFAQDNDQDMTDQYERQL